MVDKSNTAYQMVFWRDPIAGRYGPRYMYDLYAGDQPEYRIREENNGEWTLIPIRVFHGMTEDGADVSVDWERKVTFPTFMQLLASLNSPVEVAESVLGVWELEDG